MIAVIFLLLLMLVGAIALLVNHQSRVAGRREAELLDRDKSKPDYRRIAQLERNLGMDSTVSPDLWPTTIWVPLYVVYSPDQGRTKLGEATPLSALDVIRWGTDEYVTNRDSMTQTIPGARQISHFAICTHRWSQLTPWLPLSFAPGVVMTRDSITWPARSLQVRKSYLGDLFPS